MEGTIRWARMVLLTSMTLGGTAWSSAATGQGTPPPTAEARVDRIFARFDNTRSPGCAVGVVQHGELIFGRGYGMATLEHGLAITPRTVFRIGSVSKQFTAAAVALLAQEGEISLDADIRDFLPELPVYERPVTVRHLIHHTSGVRDYLVLMSLTGLRSADYYTDAEVLDMLARQEELNFLPGDEHLYSNSGYFLLSQIVLRTTGKSLAEYAGEAIFDPLGMTHSHYHDDRNHIVPDRATGYAPAGEGFRISVTQLEMVGDGGVFTTVEDLVHWVRNFDEPRVGGATFLETIHTRGRLTSGEELDYAFGIVHGDHRGLRTVSHGGSFVGYRADITTFPDEGLDIITLCNVSDANPTRLARQVSEVFLEDRMEPVAEPAARRYAAQVAAGEQPWNSIDATAVDDVTVADTGAPPVLTEPLAEAPVVLVVCVDLKVVASLDQYLDRVGVISGGSVYPFAWNIQLAARNEGLGTTITTLPVAREPELQMLLGIPEHVAVAALMPLGEPVRQLTKLRRGPVEGFATLDRFDGAPLVR